MPLRQLLEQLPPINIPWQVNHSMVLPLKHLRTALHAPDAIAAGATSMACSKTVHASA